MTDTSTNPPEAPALPDAQARWLDGLTGLRTESAAVAERIAAHEAGQQLIADTLDMDALKADMTYEVSKVPVTTWDKFKDSIGRMEKMKSLDPGGDPMKEIDSWHDLPGTEGLEPEQIRAIADAYQTVVDLRDALENNPAYQMPNPDGGPPIPDDAKIAKDLWQPLVREGIIPENMVPAQYSEVERTFGAAAEAYDARLQDYSENLSTPQKYLNTLKPAFSVAEGLMKIGSGTLGVIGNVQAVQAGADSTTDVESARELMAAARTVDTVLLCVTSVRSGAESIIENNDIYGAADAFNVILKSILTAAIGSDGAKLISNLVTVGIRGVQVTDKLASGDVAGALEAVGAAVEAGMTANDPDSAANAAYIRAGIGLMAAAAKGVQEGDARAGLAAAMGEAARAANTAGGQIMTAARDKAVAEIEADASLDRAEKDARIKETKAATSTSPTGGSDVAKGAGAAIQMNLKKMIAGNIDEDKIAERAAAYEAEQQKAMLEFRNEPDPVFEELLVNGFADTDPDVLGEDSDDAEALRLERQASQIETLIAIRQKDQMTFDLTKQIATGGTGFVASLLPAAGIIAVGTQLIFSVLEAIKHAEQLEIWADNLRDARKSGSVQAEAMLNRFGLQNQQAIRADIVAALKAVDFVGQCIKTAGGPAAPVGLAVSGSAKVAEGVMDVALTIKTEIEMANAWRVYKRALESPQDRKLARTALRDNPTLSKYAIAYGACEDKNPVAIKAMARCGLNAKTLADPGTNVSKVVTFLETLYRDDPKLLKAVLVPDAWHPGKPELTLISWQTFYLHATKSKKISPKVEEADVSMITAALGEFVKTRAPLEAMIGPAYDATGDEDIATMVAANKAACSKLESALNRFHPLQAGTSERHDGMADYLSAMEGMVAVAEGEVDDLVTEVAAAKQLAEDLAAQAQLERERAEAREAIDLEALEAQMDARFEDAEDDDATTGASDLDGMEDARDTP